MARLKDKVAIVTGGGKGIGKAISLAYAVEGASVVVAARDLAALEETAAEIRGQNGKALAIQTDITNEEHVRLMVAGALSEYGHIDILVNNSAIIGPVAPIAEMSLAGWNETMAVNLTGAMLCSREALKAMIPQRKGVIICIGSEGGRGGDGRAGRPNRAAYGCAKMGLIGLSDTMAAEAGEYGIRVNTISVGPVTGDRGVVLLKRKAEVLGISSEEMKARMVEKFSLHRVAEPSEVAAVAVFLGSDEASAVTCQVIPLNCGHHMQF
jgi:NAD(P)-dependent dehydrogenase (short-subunit alcohol dehydrogenase family)